MYATRATRTTGKQQNANQKIPSSILEAAETLYQSLNDGNGLLPNEQARVEAQEQLNKWYEEYPGLLERVRTPEKNKYKVKKSTVVEQQHHLRPGREYVVEWRKVMLDFSHDIAC